MGVDKVRLSGVYLVVDPTVDRDILLRKVQESLDGGVDILQLWNHWPEEMSEDEKEQLVEEIVDIAAEHRVPVLINEEWELLKSTELDGVHFDERPQDFEKIREEVGRDFLAGITCSNDLDLIRWADAHKLDYISFCAMFPSPSVDSCDIVKPETVRKAREITDLPLFLSGGITPEKVGELDAIDFNGVAVISGILKDESPRERAVEYEKALKQGGRN